MPKGSTAFAFVKYDGSNLRAEWSSKKGWHKFGTRTELLDPKHPIFGRAIEQWQDAVGPTIVRDLQGWNKKMLNNAGSFTAFAEWFGHGSFAGSHDPNDTFYLKVFDVSIYKRGFLDPNDFVDVIHQSQNQDTYAAYLGSMTYNDALIQHVYANGATPEALRLQRIDEGIVLKRAGRQGLERRKLKTKAWLDAIKGTPGEEAGEVPNCA